MGYCLSWTGFCDPPAVVRRGISERSRRDGLQLLQLIGAQSDPVQLLALNRSDPVQLLALNRSDPVQLASLSSISLSFAGYLGTGSTVDYRFRRSTGLGSRGHRFEPHGARGGVAWLTMR